ncbi:polysaccharide lyase family 7 protein [Streptomyces spongiae]|uniref:polysaccharide lyase family 7 protein n=1 Tax=Streptomyces spongiae TaxID=565072 RepID=UPI002AD5B0DF|nr:polysaccharide lyase family 7 protein [Streptomyces spongiae]
MSGTKNGKGLRRRSLLVGGAGAGLGLAGWGLSATPAAAAPIGSGWTEVSAAHNLHQPPDRTRHTVGSDGEHHFWLYDSDPSTFPGQDSGPRSELRFLDQYTSGSAQFEADVKVGAGAHNVCVMQVFGGSSWATAFMTLATHDSLTYYNYTDQVIQAPIYDTYLRLNVVHDTAAAAVHVFVNRRFKASYADHGRATHYFKCGLYGRAGMSARSDAYIKNIHLYRK